MARKSTSPFEDLVTIISRWPCWVSLMIGVIGWRILRPIATSPIFAPSGATLEDLSGTMLSQARLTLAMFGQYLIPPIYFFVAIDSVAHRHRRKNLLNKVKSTTQPIKTNELARFLKYWGCAALKWIQPHKRVFPDI